MRIGSASSAIGGDGRAIGQPALKIPFRQPV